MGGLGRFITSSSTSLDDLNYKIDFMGCGLFCPRFCVLKCFCALLAQLAIEPRM
jgi:hypothetical protein